MTKKRIVSTCFCFDLCRDICPRLYHGLSHVGHPDLCSLKARNKNVLILSHTVDPQKDTVAALKAYSLRFDADPAQWMFLTGDKKELYEMARYSYLISALDDTAGVSIDKDFIHDKHYALVDGFGRIRGFYDGLDPENVKQLITDIGALLKEKI